MASKQKLDRLLNRKLAKRTRRAARAVIGTRHIRRAGTKSRLSRGHLRPVRPRVRVARQMKEWASESVA